MPKESLNICWPLFLWACMYTVEIIPFFKILHHEHFYTSWKILSDNFRWLSVVLEGYHQSPAECQVVEMGWPTSADCSQTRRSRIWVEEWQGRDMQELVVRIWASLRIRSRNTDQYQEMKSASESFYRNKWLLKVKVHLKGKTWKAERRKED